MTQKKIEWSVARDFQVKKFHLLPHKCVLCKKYIKRKFVQKTVSHMEWNERYRFCSPECAKRWQLGERHPDVKKPTETDKLREFLMEPVGESDESNYE